VDGQSTIGETWSSILISKTGCNDKKQNDSDCESIHVERTNKLN